MRTAYETLIVKVDDGIVTVTLNRPEQMNAMNPQLIGEMLEVLDEIAWDEELCVVVFTGAGAAFSSGLDLKWSRGKAGLRSLAGLRTYQEGIIALQEKLRLFPRPTVAAVNGWALALGFWLAMLCDFVVVADDARLGVPQIKGGGHPAGGSIKAMAEFVPHRFAVYHLLTGEDITGPEAERLLMVNKCVPKEQLMDEAYALARKMKGIDALSVRFVKRSFWRAKQLPYAADTIELEAVAGGQLANLRNAIDAARREVPGDPAR
ncbi:MAG TPA: enoyl-CoA hydratase-related protein [Dehalococcoidia bacterium]|jgi:trans-feruloyl-CoA hydratase/vanillin synthase